MSKLITMLGFAKKARKLISGSNAVQRSILFGNSFLVIIASDAGESLKRKFTRLCEENEVKVCIYSTNEELSLLTGEYNKAIYSIENEDLANQVYNLINNG